MKIKKTLRNLLITVIVTSPFAFYVRECYKISDKIAEKVEYHDGRQGISREDTDWYRKKFEDLHNSNNYTP